MKEQSKAEKTRGEWTIYYILDGKTPKPVNDVLEWARNFENKHKVVEQTTVADVMVSTVFLGLNHQYGSGPPLLFETMIFGGEHDEYCERYSTWDEAVEGHHRACKMAFAE